MSLPYFPMYPADFEADTSHLTLEEDGAYNRLLRLMWMTPGCSVPADPKWIARRMRLDQATYDRVVAPIVDEFFQREDGRVFSPRLRREALLSQEKHQRRVEAGRKGGRSRKTPENNDPDGSNAKAKPKQPEPEPDKNEEEAGGARATEPRSEVVPLRVVASRSEAEPDDHALLRMVMDAADVPEFPIPHRWMPTTAATHVGNWRRGLGLTAAQIVEAIRLNRKARPDLGPARSPNAFDRMLAEYAAARLAPLPSPPVAATAPPSSRRSKPDERLAAWLDAARNPREPGVAGGPDRDPPQALLRD